MRIHHYDPLTGAYLGASDADASPADAGEYLVPAHATETAPPAMPAGTIARWDGLSWNLVPDRRGERYWSPEGVEHVIEDIDETPPPGSLSEPPPPTLEASRSAASQRMRAAARTAIEAGITSTALGAPHTYPTTEIDQRNLTALSLAAAVDGASDPAWRCHYWCADPADQWARREHTATQIQEVSRAVMGHIQAQQSRHESRLASIASAATWDEIAAVAW